MFWVAAALYLCGVAQYLKWVQDTPGLTPRQRQKWRKSCWFWPVAGLIFLVWWLLGWDDL